MAGAVVSSGVGIGGDESASRLTLGCGHSSAEGARRSLCPPAVHPPPSGEPAPVDPTLSIQTAAGIERNKEWPFTGLLESSVPTPVLRDGVAGLVASWTPGSTVPRQDAGVFVALWAIGRRPCWKLAPGLGMVVESPAGQCPICRPLPTSSSSLPLPRSRADRRPSLTASGSSSQESADVPYKVLCSLTVSSCLPDRRPQVCGQHGARLPLPLARGRTLQLRTLPEGCLFRAVAREMSCWLQHRLNPGAPTQEAPAPREHPHPPRPGREGSDAQSPAFVLEALP